MSPWVPPEVAAIAHRAMRFAPADRYQSADDMLDAIRPLLPQGWAIEESMFRPLADADRGQVQARLVTQPDAPVPRGARSVGGGASAISTPGPALSGPMPAGASIQGFGTTVGQGGTSSGGAGSGARTTVIAAGALAVVALGGAGAYVLTRTPPAPPAPLQQAAVIPAVAPVDAKPRTVKVVILPDGAGVEVDGAVARPNDGSVEVTGAVGSVHKVKVTTADGEVLRDVVITEGGAIPPKVEGPAAKPVAGKPAAPTPAKPQPAGPAPGPSPLRLQR